MKISFIGLGKLGLPCAEVMAKKGHDVSGYDIVRPLTSLISVKNNYKDAIAGAQIIFVAVPTAHDPMYDGDLPTSHLPPKDFDYRVVKSVLTEINKHITDRQILVLISTVLPGTVRREFIDLIKYKHNFVYNPYLIAMGSVAEDMVNPEMIMLGSAKGAQSNAAWEVEAFYKTIMENKPRVVIGTWEECEAIKVFYNTFISAKIGLVNMIQDVATKIGNMNVDIVTDALAKSSMRIMGPRYMVAGMGDGGACHPRDNIALRYMAQELGLGYDLFEAIMYAREKQAENIAKVLVQYSENRIYIHGKAYKPGVPYTAGSYSTLIGHYCEQEHREVIYVDPLTGDNVESMTECILLAHSANVTYGTKEYPLYAQIVGPATVVDPWRKFYSRDPEVQVIHYGNTRDTDIHSSSY